MDHIGIDVHKNASHVCIRTETGQLIERCEADEQTPKRFAHGPTGLQFDEASASQQWPWRASSPASCLRCGAMAPTLDKQKPLQRMLDNPRQSSRTNTYVLPR